MASFNLGRIKGDKGEKGDTGAMGERGPQGERGDKGDSGRDGKTPVFTIGETITLPSGEEAYVQLDTTDAENPVLTFGIPRGDDGRDANGDMERAIYDSEGRGEDFYKYAQALFENSLKKDNAIAVKLSVGGADTKSAVARNVSMRSTFPESASEGDICIITEDKNAKELGGCEIGTSMVVEELGENAEYIIIAKDYHGEGTVTLMRKRKPAKKVKFSYQGNESYSMSHLDMTNSFFINKFSEEFRKKLVCVALDANDSRFCFSLSKEDFDEIDYLKEPSNRPFTDTTEEYFTRTVSSDKVYCVMSTGAVMLATQSTGKYYRPIIVLPSGMKVENTIYSDSSMVKMESTKKGVYAFMGGEWKECASL